MRVVEAYEEVELQRHTSFSSFLGGYDWWTSRPGRFSIGGRSPV